MCHAKNSTDCAKSMPQRYAGSGPQIIVCIYMYFHHPFSSFRIMIKKIRSIYLCWKNDISARFRLPSSLTSLHPGAHLKSSMTQWRLQLSFCEKQPILSTHPPNVQLTLHDKRDICCVLELHDLIFCGPQFRQNCWACGPFMSLTIISPFWQRARKFRFHFCGVKLCHNYWASNLLIFLFTYCVKIYILVYIFWRGGATRSYFIDIFVWNKKSNPSAVSRQPLFGGPVDFWDDMTA